ncbi:MAG: hypothetical protein K2N03_07325 [Muribaculaceae bacterium]|nr:hypothetical protein [Muribaculaceae bacterium]
MNNPTYRRLLHIAVAAFLIPAISSCIDPADSVTIFQDIPGQTMLRGQALEFSPDSAQLSKLPASPSRMVIHVRYNSDVSVESLPLGILIESYLQPARQDSISLQLFRDKHPLGKGIHSVYTLSDTIPLNSFPEGWRVSLTSLSVYPVNGINSLGISLLP